MSHDGLKQCLRQPWIFECFVLSQHRLFTKTLPFHNQTVNILHTLFPWQEFGKLGYFDIFPKTITRISVNNYSKPYSLNKVKSKVLMISFPVLIQGFQMISRRKLTFSRKFQGIPATLLTKHERMNDWVFSIFELRIQYPYTAWKVSKYAVISGPYFPVFGLNTERYAVIMSYYLLQLCRCLRSFFESI